jgi:hypothetical protein
VRGELAAGFVSKALNVVEGSMKRTAVALSLLMLLGWAPVAAQEHQHGAQPDIKSEAVAPPTSKPPAAKNAMSEKMAEMKRKMAEKMKAPETASPVGKNMMKGHAPNDSSKNEEKK